MRIGILETGRPDADLLSVHGDYPTMIERFLGARDPTFRFSAFVSFKGELPKVPEDCDAYLITGSPRSVYEQLGWIIRLKDFAATCHSLSIPTVGLCFGHQVLAEALGGKVEKAREGWGLGVHEYDIYERPAWTDLASSRLAVPVVHQDQVIRLPQGAKVIAGSEFCPYAAIVYSDIALSFQAHPEFSRSYTRDLLRRHRASTFPATTVDAALQTLDRSTDSATVAGWIASFLHHATASNEPERRFTAR